MRSVATWIRRGLLLVLVAGVGLTVVRALRPTGGHDPFVPTIGGDTWPPVPVKDARAV